MDPLKSINFTLTLWFVLTTVLFSRSCTFSKKVTNDLEASFQNLNVILNNEEDKFSLTIMELKNKKDKLKKMFRKKAINSVLKNKTKLNIFKIPMRM